MPPASIGVLPELSVTPDLLPLLSVGPDEPLPPSGGPLRDLADTLLIGPIHAGERMKKDASEAPVR